MYKYVKRILDLISASLLLIIIFPVFLILMLMVKTKIGSPIFFKQIRSGMHQKDFFIFKFRSMTDERDADGNLLSDEIRLTKFGRFLRSTSLDELPELLSIIKGDMSVIGPRPLPPEYNNYYTEREKLRFDVRGGLLPPDSIETSAIITWDKQLEYEAKYVENLSFFNDLKILLGAIRIVFNRNKTDYGAYVRKSLIEERKNEIYN